MKKPKELPEDDEIDEDEMDENDKEWAAFRRAMSSIKLCDFNREPVATDGHVVMALYHFAEGKSYRRPLGEVLCGPTKAKEIINSDEWQEYVSKITDDDDSDDPDDPPYFVIYNRRTNDLRLMQCPEVSRTVTQQVRKKGKPMATKTMVETSRPCFTVFSAHPDGNTFAATAGKEIFLYDLD